MKVLQILPELNIGGVETGAVDLCKFLEEQGIPSAVVSAGGDLVGEIERFNTRHYLLPVNKKSLCSMVYCIRKIHRIIKSEEITVVHARSRVPFWIGFFATRNTGAAFCATMHGCYSANMSSRVIRWIQCIICPSDFAAHYFNRRLSIPFQKITVIPRWVDLERFSFLPYEQRSKIDFTVCYIGRLTPAKGIEYLLRSLVKVKRVVPRIRLKLVGDSRKKRYIKRLKDTVERYGLRSTVDWVGSVRDIQTVLHGAHVTVMPSVGYESFGRVIIEAQACGSIIIATNTGAQEEIIRDGMNGFVVIPRDSEGIADRIIKILTNPETSKAIAREARRSVEEKYVLKKIGPRIIDLYREIQEVAHIAVIKLSSLGDVVLAIPTVRALKKHFPRCRLSVLVQRRFMKVLEGIESIDELIPYDNQKKGIGYPWSAASLLRQKSFDYLVDLQNNYLSHFLGFLSFARVRIGYNRKWGFLLHKKAAYRRGENTDPLASQQKILTLIGVQLSAEDFRLSLLPEWERSAGAFLTQQGIKNDAAMLIGIHVSASAAWDSKNWPVVHIRKLIALLIKDTAYTVVLSGDAQSVERSHLITEGTVSERLINLCGKTTLPHFMCVVKRCAVFICPDTAALHIATALGTPVIGLFGPTDPLRHCVKKENVFVVSRKLDCAYCYKRKCLRSREKDRGNESLCMKKISPHEIASMVTDIIRTTDCSVT